MPSNIVVDLSHFNANVDFKRARRAGIAGAMHKATQGVLYRDPTYPLHKANAEAAGFLWGAYHFGVGGDAVAQAEYFLNTVDPDERTLLALDFEVNPQGPSMDLEEARTFVVHIKNALGRYPGLYGGHYLKTLLGTRTDPVLANCWFWLSQYGPTPVMPSNWQSWMLWQYTDGAMGPPPYEIPGIGRCDRDLFNGTEAELQIFWGAAKAALGLSHVAAP